MLHLNFAYLNIILNIKSTYWYSFELKIQLINQISSNQHTDFNWVIILTISIGS